MQPGPVQPLWQQWLDGGDAEVGQLLEVRICRL
jgi:hypothetical protein